MIFVIFGTGVNCQVNLSSSTSVTSSPRGVRIYYFFYTVEKKLIEVFQDWTSVSLGWAAGLCILSLCIVDFI